MFLHCLERLSGDVPVGPCELHKKGGKDCAEINKSNRTLADLIGASNHNDIPCSDISCCEPAQNQIYSCNGYLREVGRCSETTSGPCLHC